MRKSWTQTGMSLVEMMIGGAMLAGVALVGAELFKRQLTSVKDVGMRAELDAFHSQLVSIVSDTRNCNRNFYNYSGSTITNTSFSEGFVKCCPNQNANPDCVLSNTSCAAFYLQTDQIFWMGKKKVAYIGDLATPSYPGGYKLQSISVTNSTLSGPAVASSGTGSVRASINVLYRSSTPSVAQDIIKRIPVVFKYKDNNFITCVDAESGSKNTLQQEICRTLGPSLATYNDYNDKCEYKDTAPTHSCPIITGDPRSILVGLNSVGDPVCRTGTDAFNESDAINPADASGCGAGANVGFYYDSVTKTIRVQCL